MDLQILSMAPTARRWLRQSQIARILHVFDPVCNLINEEGEVLSLVDPFVGNGPFSALVERGLFTSWITAESKVQLSNALLHIDDSRISFESVQTWEPRPNWELLKNSSKQLLQASDTIEELLREHAPPESFAEVVLPITFATAQESPALKKARVAINQLLPAIIDEDSATMRIAATTLGGLGAGLTPAGDDFLVGVIHALWATRPQAQALTLSLVLAEAAVPRTNSLSAAWLNAASQGEAGEPWHELVQAIDGDDAEAVEAAVMRILPTGHSSGADALGGFIALVRMTSKENQQ